MGCVYLKNEFYLVWYFDNKVDTRYVQAVFSLICIEGEVWPGGTLPMLLPELDCV